MPTVDDLARFLAGLPSTSSADPFAELRESPAWAAHAAWLDAAFGAFRHRSLTPFRAWASRLTTNARHAKTLFYPFGGPDFAFARTLAPSAERLILCGRERWGPLPPADEAAALSLAPIRAFLSHYLERGFFVTQDMESWLAAHPQLGLAHVLLVLVARMGQTIDAIGETRLEADGAPASSVNGDPASGLRISFGDGARQAVLHYFQQDLRDPYFDRDAALAGFVAKAPPCVSFCKCASYLPHEPAFANITRFVLDVSTALIQDDSSLPYRLLDRPEWDVALHGRYAAPLPVFARHAQQDLGEAYDRAPAGPTPMGFRITYGGERRTGLMVAVSREPGRRPLEAAPARAAGGRPASPGRPLRKVEGGV
jgi:hypothetical protein